MPWPVSAVWARSWRCRESKLGWSLVAVPFWIYFGLLFRAFGNQFAWRGGYRAAVACFSRALGYAPQNAHLYFWRGTLYWRELGEIERAEADLTRAIELNPQMARAYLNRGLARWYAAKVDRAAAAADLRAFLERSDDAYWREVALRLLEQVEQPPVVGGLGTVS